MSDRLDPDEVGRCDTCGAPYLLAERNVTGTPGVRCGDCGDCSACCVHRPEEPVPARRYWQRYRPLD